MLSQPVAPGTTTWYFWFAVLWCQLAGASHSTRVCPSVRAVTRTLVTASGKAGSSMVAAEESVARPTSPIARTLTETVLSGVPVITHWVAAMFVQLDTGESSTNTAYWLFSLPLKDGAVQVTVADPTAQLV